MAVLEKSRVWNLAVSRLNQLRPLFIKELFGNKRVQLLAMSVVFPEVLRRSSQVDFVKKNMMTLSNLLSKDAGLLDYSIGEFQMKPSFVARLELASGTKVENDETIVENLDNTRHQLTYLHLFLDYCLTDNEELAKLPIEDQIRLVSTAYTFGYFANPMNLQRESKMAFWTSSALRLGQRYPYSQIALAYYYQTLR